MRKFLFVFYIFIFILPVLATTGAVSSYTGYDWQYGDSKAQVCVYLDRQIVSSGGKVLNNSIVGEGGWYKKIDCNVFTESINCPNFTIDSTTDANPATAKYTFVFCDDRGIKRDVLGTFGISSKPSVTKIADLILYNSSTQKNLHPTYLTRTQTETRLDESTGASAYITDKTIGAVKQATPPTVPANQIAVNANDTAYSSAGNSKYLKDYVSLNAAIKAIALTETELVIDKDVNVTKDTMLPANIRIRMTGSAKFIISTGVTLTIASQIYAGSWQIFNTVGTGKVVFSNKPADIFPEWWGAKPNDFTSAQQSLNVSATQAAILASTLNVRGGRIVFTSGGNYFFNSSISLDDLQGITLTAAGEASSKLTYTRAGSGKFITLNSSQRIKISNLEISYDNAGYTGNLISADHSANGGDSGYLVFQDLTLGGDRKTTGAASLIRLNRAIIIQVERVRFGRAAVGIVGTDTGSYSNVVSVRNCTFVLQTVSAIKNAKESWLFDSNTIEPLASGATVMYVQDDYKAYNLNFINNWIGDGKVAANAVTTGGFGLTFTGNRFELTSGSKAIVIAGGSQGISITGNRTNSVAVDFGTSGYSRGISIAGNSFNAVSPIIGNKLEYNISGNVGIPNSTDLTSNFYNQSHFYEPVTINNTLTMGTGGTPISKVLSVSASVDFGRMPANSCEDLDVTGFSSLANGDVVSLGVPVALANNAGTTLTGFVKNTTTVTVRRCNVAASAASDPAAALIRVQVTKF